MAIKLQYAMENMYPSITKPILISEYGYNQGATNGSMILEVGCNGNTLQGSAAARYFADGAAEVIASAIEKKLNLLLTNKKQGDIINLAV